MATDTSPPEEEPINGPLSNVSVRKMRAAFTNAPRTLSAKEFNNPAVQKLLLDEIERLENERDELKEFRTKFHAVDKQVVLLEQKCRSALAYDIISVVCFCLGSASISYAKNFSGDPTTFYTSIIFGSILLITGIAARVVRR